MIKSFLQTVSMLRNNHQQDKRVSAVNTDEVLIAVSIEIRVEFNNAIQE